MAISRCLKLAAVVLAVGVAGQPHGQADAGPAPGAAEERLKTVGLIEAWRTELAVCQVDGFSTIASILPKGAVVKKGEPVCELDSAHLKAQLAYQLMVEAEAKDAYLEAKAGRERAERENGDVRRRMADEKARRSSWERVQEGVKYLREQVDFCTVTAPSDGAVGHPNDFPRPDGPATIAPGATVRTRQVLFKISDPSALVVHVKIDEAIIDRLKVGQRARIEVDKFPTVLDGAVHEIAVLPDPLPFFGGAGPRVYPVRVKLDTRPKDLQPGMTARVEIRIPRAS